MQAHIIISYSCCSCSKDEMTEGVPFVPVILPSKAQSCFSNQKAKLSSHLLISLFVLWQPFIPRSTNSTPSLGALGLILLFFSFPVFQKQIFQSLPSLPVAVGTLPDWYDTQRTAVWETAVNCGCLPKCMAMNICHSFKPTRPQRYSRHTYFVHYTWYSGQQWNS